MEDALPALLPLIVLGAGILTGQVWRSRWWHDRQHGEREGFLCDHCLTRFRAARKVRLDTMYRESRERSEEFSARQAAWLADYRRDVDRIMERTHG